MKYNCTNRYFSHLCDDPGILAALSSWKTPYGQKIDGRRSGRLQYALVRKICKFLNPPGKGWNIVEVDRAAVPHNLVRDGRIAAGSPGSDRLLRSYFLEQAFAVFRIVRGTRTVQSP